MSLDRPIVILGAARSGTKMLRGVLAAHPRLSAVPWDVNFIWKYGNYNVPHDELMPDDLTPDVRQFIRRSLAQFAKQETSRLVEKTVGNALRPEFVQGVLPDCVFIHIVRDGRAVAESARRMWQAPMDWRNVVRKLRLFPPRALPTYGVDYARSYLKRFANRGSRAVKTWGPRWRSIESDLEALPLIELCAVQWERCVQHARETLSRLPATGWIEIRYEKLCAEPVAEAGRVFDFLGMDFPQQVRDHVARTVTGAHSSKWNAFLTPAEIASVTRHAGPLLRELGYIAGD